MIELLNKYSKRPELDKVIIVANVYGKTQYYNTKKENLKIEFFSEEEINNILNSLKDENYNFELYVDETKFISDILTKKNKITEKTLVFNLARNGIGVSKKSLIPTFCDLQNIKYTSSSGYVCSLARNKYHYSLLLLQNNLNGTESFQYNDGWLLDKKPKLNTELIMKPLFESASKNISMNNIINSSDLNFEKKVLDYNKKIGEPIVIQKFIRGYEAKIPIFEFDRIIALDPIGVKIKGKHLLNNEIITENLSIAYDYDNYMLKEVFDEELCNDIKDKAIKIFELLGMRNYGRIDCRITPQGEYYFYDIATMPFFTNHSEMNYSMKINNLNQGKLFNIIFNSAMYYKY